MHLAKLITPVAMRSAALQSGFQSRVISIACMVQHIINKYKEQLIILQSIEIIVIKNKKQEWSPTSADILVGI